MKGFNHITPALLLVALTLSGCDSGNTDAVQPAGSDTSSALVPDYQLETLRKAKQVDSLVKKQDQKIRDAVQ